MTILRLILRPIYSLLVLFLALGVCPSNPSWPGKGDAGRCEAAGSKKPEAYSLEYVEDFFRAENDAGACRSFAAVEWHYSDRLLGPVPQWELTAAPMFVNALAPDPSMPVYKPPKEKTPRARIEGGVRGGPGNGLTIMALAPDHVGFTMKKDPTLYWYISQATSLAVHFTLIDSRSVPPAVELTLPHPKEAGLQRIRLKDHRISLVPGVQYRWFISVAVDPDRPSDNLVTGGMVERIEFNEGSTLGFPLTCDKDAVYRYADAGLWYDALGCISELIESRPHDSRLRKQRAALLMQVDLPNIAEEDLRHKGTH